jgi:HEPN domain-containing protein
MAHPECANWLRFARDDFETAEYLLGMQPRKIEIICYHCQQCAEKSLKAVFALFDEEIPRSHDFRTLLKTCECHFPSVNSLIDILPKLQPYAVAVRYPYEIQIAAGDEERAIENARLVISTIETAIRARQDSHEPE